SDIRQDEDVLDTWFSSQLWPFSTLGWPERTHELEYFYPTSVIVPGYDIIHLWVSRMIMSGLHFMGDVPFRHALIHGIVRDADGKKMSKSAGNVRDPLDLMDKYGTDALRFTLAEHATGQDIFLHEEWLGGSRNFSNKLWNAARFVLSDLRDEGSIELPPRTRWTLADRWIMSRLERLTDEVTEMIEGFEISAAARSLYEFTWSSYCDWYIEAAKPRLYSKDEGSRSDVVAILVHVLTRTIKLLHPIMPFITEEIWSYLPGAQGHLIVAEWPSADMQATSLIDEQRFESVQEVVTALRRFRANHGIPLKTELPVGVHGQGDGFAQLLGVKADLSSLARHCLFDFEPAAETKGPNARLVAGGVELRIPLEGLLDLGAERTRLTKALSDAASEIDRIETKLGNPRFVDKAPAPVVEEHRRRLDESLELRTKLAAQLEELN
ncbi:MAG TPA: class I tRNA ligase family protein, partial [Actinomycetota bacterium]|nr:class I tRNA ligase family protein [Actinomycetota bacterium]